MSKNKQLWLLVGGNGAGKTTFYNLRLAPLGIPFVNADILAGELYPDAPEENSIKAARVAEEIRYNLIREGRSFCFETVFSHPSKIDFVAHAKALGYEIIMVFIHLNSAMLNKARVAQRVASGGHNVPEIRVEQRIPRLLEHVKTAMPLCDQVRILDNSLIDNPFLPVATVRDQHVNVHQEILPDWANTLLSNESF